MTKKDELWTTYALRRFEQAGLEFEGWYTEGVAGEDNISYLNRGSGNNGIVVVLSTIYSETALDELLTSSRPDQYQMFLEGKITNYFSFGNENSYIDFSINPAGKVVVEERYCDKQDLEQRRLFPRKKEAQRKAADFLEQLVQYTERVLSPPKEESPIKKD